MPQMLKLLQGQEQDDAQQYNEQRLHGLEVLWWCNYVMMGEKDFKNKDGPRATS